MLKIQMCPERWSDLGGSLTTKATREPSGENSTPERWRRESNASGVSGLPVAEATGCCAKSSANQRSQDESCVRPSEINDWRVGTEIYATVCGDAG